jgi:sugar phosphate permease
VAASALAAFLLAHYGWRSAFFWPGFIIIAAGLLLLLFLPSDKEQLHDSAKDVDQTQSAGNINIWRNPFVWILGFSYFSLKLIRYSLLFWLPFYFHRRLGIAEESAGYLSIVLEVGGVLGAIATGYFADRFFGSDRTRIIAPMLFGLAISLLAYQMIGESNLWTNALAMSAIGFFIYGPDTLISGACSQDIGGAHQTASVAGAINGLGSLGAIFQGAVTAYISESWGWDTLFTTFTALALASGIAVAIALTLIAKRNPAVTPA